MSDDANLDIRISARNETAGAFREVEDEAEDFGDVVGKAAKAVEWADDALQHLRASTHEFGQGADDALRDVWDAAEKMRGGVDDAADSVHKADAALDQAAGSAKGATRGLDELGTTAKVAIGTFVGNVAVQALQALKREMVEGWQAGVEYRTGLDVVAANLDLTAEEAGVLEAAINRASAEAAGGTYTAQELAAAYGLVHTNVRNVNDVYALIVPSANLAMLAHADLGATTEGVSRILDIYGLSATDAGRVSNVLYNTFNTGGASIQSTTAFLIQNGAVLDSLGIKLEEAAALHATLQKAGVEGAQSIIMAYGRLYNDTDGLRLKLHELGIEIMDTATGRMRTLPEVLEEIRSKGLASEEVLALFGVRGVAAMNAIIERGPDFDKTVQANAGNVNGLGDATARLGSETSASVARVRTWWDNLKVDTADAAVGVVDHIGDIGQAYNEWEAKTLASHNRMTDKIQQFSDFVGERLATSPTSVASSLQTVAGAAAEAADSIPAVAPALDIINKAEYDLHKAATAATDALLTQGTVSREKGQKTLDLSKVVTDLGLSEAQARAIITETTESMSVQKDGTIVLKDKTGELVAAYQYQNGILAEVTQSVKDGTIALDEKAGAAGRAAEQIGVLAAAEKALRDGQTAGAAKDAVFEFGDYRALLMGDDKFDVYNRQGGKAGHFDRAAFAQLLGWGEDQLQAEFNTQFKMFKATGSTQLGGDAPASGAPSSGGSSAGGAVSWDAMGRPRNADGSWARPESVGMELIQSVGDHHQLQRRGETYYLWDVAGAYTAVGSYQAIMEKIRNVPYLADGGMTQGITRAILGDNPSGQEVVLPMDSQRTISTLADALDLAMMRRGGGGGDVHIHVENVTVRDGRDLERQFSQWGLKRRLLG